MSQAFMDAYVNRIGEAALNYYNIEAIDNLLSELSETEC